MDLSLFFLGTAGSVPSARRGLPAVLVRRGGERLLFDCGEGTQRQLLRSVGLPDLDAVFITHFHADHWLGLPGMLKSFALRERSEPLTVYGPRGLGELMGVMRAVYGRLPYELGIVELEPAQAVALRGLSRWRRSRCVTRATRRSATRSSRTHARGTSTPRWRSGWACSPGPDFGRLQRGETVGGVAPGAGDGREPRGAQGRPLGRHGAVRGAGAGGAPGGRAGARGDVRRGRGGARARRRFTAPRARLRSWRATPRCGCWR